MCAACKGMPRNVQQGWRSRDLLWGNALVKGFLLNGPRATPSLACPRTWRPKLSSDSRATDLTILAGPLNMQGMPGALQVPAALLHGVQTIHTNDSNKEPNIVGSLDLTVTQVEQATTFFQQALLPHPMWCGPLPVCLVEHHHGKVRRLRLVLATITHLTKAEINSLVEGPYLLGGTVLHDLVCGYAADASMEPEWLVIADGQQPEHW